MNAPMELPVYIWLTCYACALLAGVFLWLTVSKSKLALGVWLALMGVSLGLAFFIPNSVDLSLALLLSLVPALIVLTVVGSEKWPAISENFNDAYAHYFHLWRLPASFVPLWLYQEGIVPIEMTFEGLNLDIIAGLTAPVLSSLAFGQQMLGRTVVLVWNILAALLLITSAWIVYDEMLINNTLKSLFTSFPFAILLFTLMPLSLTLHLMSIWRIIKGKMQLTD